MYVRLCPRISASSRTPPKDTFTKFFPNARAMDRPSDVFPTPGGPTKQRICPFMSLPAWRRAAKNSRILSFTLRSP